MNGWYLPPEVKREVQRRKKLRMTWWFRFRMWLVRVIAPDGVYW